MKKLCLIILILFYSFGYSQLIFEKPDSSRIVRANAQSEIASLLIDADADFFENSSSFVLNDEIYEELVIHVKNANSLNVYFDSLKINKNSTLEIYNESGELELILNSHSNLKGGLYAIPPIKGQKLRFVFKGNKVGTEILIGEIGYFWSSLNELATSKWCQIDVNCQEGNQWLNQKNGVVRLLLRKNSFSVYCTGTLLNNTARDCKPYILSADHCADRISLNDLKQSVAVFNYENSACDFDDATTENFVSGLTFRAKSSFYDGSDILLLELNNEVPLEYNAYFNGWNISNGGFSSGVSIHHPAGDVKKISTYSTGLTTASEYGLTEAAYWKVNWTATINGHGVTETGSSGSPIFNQEKLVVGALSGGDSNCSKPDDPDIYGKVSYSWSNQLDSSKRLDVWLDPLQTFNESLTGSYFPCDDTTKQYIPVDSISIELNPTYRDISLYVEQNISNSVKVFLIDVSGKIIRIIEKGPSNIMLIEIPTHNMLDGLYFLVVRLGGRERVFKVVVVN